MRYGSRVVAVVADPRSGGLYECGVSVWVEIHLENQDLIPYFQGEMIERRLTSTLAKRLSQTPVVALLGSRQVGKTTLARNLDVGKPSHYLDLERPSDVAKLADPELYLGRFSDHLVILDEIQRFPDLFSVLRSLVDERRRAGEKSAQFLILGSASPELLQQSSESLAGRISYLELDPLNLTELGPGHDVIDQHWFRGGYWWKREKEWAARTQKLPGLDAYERKFQLGWNKKVIDRRPEVQRLVDALQPKK